MLQLSEISYFPKNEGDSNGIWFPEGDAEEAKIKTLQSLLKVPVTGDFDNATRKAVLLKDPMRIILGRGSVKDMIADIDKLIAKFQPPKKTPETDTDKPKTGGGVMATLDKYKWYLIGGTAIVGVGVMLKKRGMFGGIGATTPEQSRERQRRLARERAIMRGGLYAKTDPGPRPGWRWGGKTVKWSGGKRRVVELSYEDCFLKSGPRKGKIKKGHYIRGGVCLKILKRR